MALNIVMLEKVVPPESPIFGVPIATIDQAMDLWQWAAQTPGYTCAIVAKADGTQAIEIAGATAAGVSAQIGGDQWIVLDNNAFLLFATAADALTIYRVVPNE